MDAASRLYIGEGRYTQAKSSRKRVQAAARRLADVLTQLDLTWDLYDLSTEKLLDLLPSEFDEFKS